MLEIFDIRLIGKKNNCPKKVGLVHSYQMIPLFAQLLPPLFLHIRDNTILEVAIAGSWISTVLWLIIFILMVKERHHIKAHLTDESMWGSGKINITRGY